MPPITPELLAALVGALLFGSALSALLLRRQAEAAYQRGRAEPAAELARLHEALDSRNAELARVLTQCERLGGDLSGLRERADRLSDERAAALGRLEQLDPLRADLRRSQIELAAARNELQRLTGRLAEAEARSDEQRRASDEKLRLLSEAETRLRETFQTLAEQILDERSRRFGEVSQKEIGGLVEPLKEQLREFREAITATHAVEQRERGMLSAEITTLKQLNQQISEDAVNLTRALRGDTQTQGAWGELVLERLLQASGLQPGREYETQGSFQNEEGGRARPDVIVRLPDDKDLVIDAKVSLVAYERHVVASEPALAEAALREHIASLKRHIEQLAARRYSELPGLRTLDFVLMFVPVEAAFIEAVRRDESLYLFALERNVALVSPSTLLATLRTVAHLWKIERRNVNATEIAVKAGRLVDYVASLVGEIEAIGVQLGKAQDTQVRALRRLTEGGKGSILLQVQNLADLGARASKSLPGALLQKADDEAAGSDSAA